MSALLPWMSPGSRLSREYADVADECRRKIERIAHRRPELSKEAIATALQNYAMSRAGSTLRYLELAERCAVAGLALPWEHGEVSDLAQHAFLRLVETGAIRIERADATDVEISYPPNIPPPVKRQEPRAWVRMNNQPWKRR